MEEVHRDAIEDAIYRALEAGEFPADIIGEIHEIIDQYLEDELDV